MVLDLLDELPGSEQDWRQVKELKRFRDETGYPVDSITMSETGSAVVAFSTSIPMPESLRSTRPEFDMVSLMASIRGPATGTARRRPARPLVLLRPVRPTLGQLIANRYQYGAVEP